jgi:peptidoglycan/LPS O-acetylase OafA/YrhL
MQASRIVNTRPQRLDVLDLARGAGFLIVLLVHCTGFLGFGVTDRLAPQAAMILDFFFLMSGFFAGYAQERKLHTGEKAVSQAIADRATRVFPLIALGTLLGVISIYLRPEGTLTLWPLLISALKQLILMPADRGALGTTSLFPLDGPLWFLLYDTLAYLLFLFVLRHLSLKWLIAVAAVTASALWWAAISKNTLSFGTLWADCAWSVPRCLASFTIGYILFRLYKPDRFVIGPRFGLLPVTALLAVVLLPVPVDWAYSGMLQAVVATLVMPMIIFFGANVQASSKLKSVAGLVGPIAMPVYILHYPIIRILAPLRWDLHLHGLTGDALLIVEFFLPILLAYLFTKYLEQPLRRRPKREGWAGTPPTQEIA